MGGGVINNPAETSLDVALDDFYYVDDDITINGFLTYYENNSEIPCASKPILLSIIYSDESMGEFEVETDEEGEFVIEIPSGNHVEGIADITVVFEGDDQLTSCSYTESVEFRESLSSDE